MLPNLRIAIFSLVIFAIGLFLYTKGNEFPYFYHVDEPGKVHQIMTRDWNFNHPMLMLTTTRWGAEALGRLNDPQAVVVIGRTVSAVFMAAAVALLAAAVWLRAGALAGVLAGVLLLTNRHPFELSHYFKEDPAFLFGLGVWTLGLVLFCKRPSTAHGLFLGLAKDPAHRHRLKDAILFSGIIDLQDTIINRGGYQNIGHKALRARALVDIADYLGWENAHELIYTVVPDLGCSPRLHGLWTEISNICRMEIPAHAAIPKRSDRPLSERDLDRLTEAILWGGPFDVNAAIMSFFKRGAGSLDVGDAVIACYQRYLIDVLENPHAFLHPTHALDYMNVVQSWARNHDNPHQVKAVFMGARFMNDSIRSNAIYPRDPAYGLEHRHNYRAWADGIAVERILTELTTRVLAQDAPRSCALVDSYLSRTTERQLLLDTITYASCHWQNDPHVMRNCASSIEEYKHNRTSRRDDIIRGYVKHQSRYIKRALTHDCYRVFVDHFRPAND